jgi:hypothetical protein
VQRRTQRPCTCSIRRDDPTDPCHQRKRPQKAQKTGYLGKNPRPTGPYSNSYNNNNNRRESSHDSICASLTSKTKPEYLPITLSLFDKAMEEIATAKTGTATTAPTEARVLPTAPTAHRAPAPTTAIKAQALLDSGSLAGNFIRHNTLIALGGIGKEYISPEPLRVCSGLDNACYDSTHVVDVVVSFIESNTKHSFVLTCRISLMSQVNLIIGRQSIKDNKLVSKLPRFFFDTEDITDNTKCQPCTNTHGDTTHRHKHCHTLSCACAIPAQAAASANGPHTGLSPTTMSDTDNPRLQRDTRKVHFDDTHLEVAKEVAIPSATNDTRYQTWDGGNSAQTTV